MKAISLTQGKCALVDDSDFEELSKLKWYAHKKHSGLWYAVRNIRKDGGGRTLIAIHNVIMGSKSVDHVDGDGLNNQRSNLRLATQSQNNLNRRKMSGTTSRYKGVHFHLGKWVAMTSVHNKTLYLGRFTSEIDAYIAYRNKISELGNAAFIKHEATPTSL